MKIGVKVLPRKEVLDTQGRAVQSTLDRNGFKVQECKVGRYITLEVDGSSKDEALAKAKEVAEYVLFNPLIEDFELEVLES